MMRHVFGLFIVALFFNFNSKAWAEEPPTFEVNFNYHEPYGQSGHYGWDVPLQFTLIAGGNQLLIEYSDSEHRSLVRRNKLEDEYTAGDDSFDFGIFYMPGDLEGLAVHFQPVEGQRYPDAYIMALLPDERKLDYEKRGLLTSGQLLEKLVYIEGSRGVYTWPRNSQVLKASFAPVWDLNKLEFIYASGIIYVQYGHVNIILDCNCRKYGRYCRHHYYTLDDLHPNLGLSEIEVEVLSYGGNGSVDLGYSANYDNGSGKTNFDLCRVGNYDSSKLQRFQFCRGDNYDTILQRQKGMR